MRRTGRDSPIGAEPLQAAHPDPHTRSLGLSPRDCPHFSLLLLGSPVLELLPGLTPYSLDDYQNVRYLIFFPVARSHLEPRLSLARLGNSLLFQLKNELCLQTNGTGNDVVYA